MPWKTYNSQPVIIPSSLFYLLFLFSFSLLFTGCAKKPWTDPLAEDETKSINQLLNSLSHREAACGPTLISDLTFVYKNPFNKKGLSGFFQFSQPSSYQFVVSNPLGQPLLVIAGDEKSFQAINTQNRSYLAGRIRSFALRNDIPGYFVQSNWGSWLTGRYKLAPETITDIRYDRDQRGIWLTFHREGQQGTNHLLFDREKELFVEYIMEKENGSTAAKISYGDWLFLGECRQPREIKIEGLDYGTELSLKLSNIEMSHEQKSYQLRPPRGYNRRYMP